MPLLPARSASSGGDLRVGAVTDAEVREEGQPAGPAVLRARSPPWVVIAVPRRAARIPARLGGGGWIVIGRC